MFKIGILLTIILAIVASFVTGIIYTKRLIRRNRYVDMLETLRQRELAQQLRNDKPYVAYHWQAGMLGVIVGLVINLLWVLAMFLTGQDLFEHRRALMPLLASSMIVGFLATGLAVRIVSNKRTGGGP